MAATVKVAITGPLSIKRAVAIRLLEEKTKARFSPSVSWDTSYLVASRFDTEKAHRAARLGTIIISESEMMAFIASGRFPEAPTLALRRAPPNLPHIFWSYEADPEKAFYMRYRDRDGALSDRFLFCLQLGTSREDGAEYLGGFDVERFKTFRADRVLMLAEAAAREELPLADIKRYWSPVARPGAPPAFQVPAPTAQPCEPQAPAPPQPSRWQRLGSLLGSVFNLRGLRGVSR